MTKKRKIAYNILRVLVSILFVFAAIPKLVANPQSVAGFTLVGLPMWFMYTIGIGEICGVIGLWIPKLFRYAYEGLFLVLAGAIVTTFVYLGALMAILPIVAAIMLGFIVWLHSKGTSAPAA